MGNCRVAQIPSNKLDKSERRNVDTMEHLNIDRFLKVWSEILSDHYGVEVKLTAIKKEEIAA